MIKKTVTTFECDLCGSEETKERWHSSLPSAEFGLFDSSSTGFLTAPTETFCDACVTYVAEARDRAVNERRALAALEAVRA